MQLQDSTLDEMIYDIARVAPRISGSTASLVAAQIGAAMAKMALLVSARHGADTDLVVERLDALVTDLGLASERDRSASVALIDARRRTADPDALSEARIDATMAPLDAARLLVDASELLLTFAPRVDRSVASDYFGGAQLIGAAFTAVSMAIESNVQTLDDLRDRTAKIRHLLNSRHATVAGSLRVAALRSGVLACGSD